MSAVLKLYETVDALETVRDWCAEHADEIIAAGGDIGALPELAALVDQAEGDFNEKAERVALFIRELVLSSAAVAEEGLRLARRSTQLTKAADALKQYLLLNMQRAKVKKVKGKLVTVRVQASPASVESALTDEELARLYTFGTIQGARSFVSCVPATYTLDKQAVKEAAALGEPIPAGVSVVRGNHVRIV